MNPNIKEQKHTYFDFNRTSIDSKEAITKSIGFTLNEMGLSSPTANELECSIESSYIKKQKCIYFDLDGTLIDSKEGVTKSIQFALKEMGLPSPTANELEWCIGPPLNEVFKKLINNASESTLNTALMYYRERYSGIGIYEVRLYTDIEWMLSNLKQEGFRLFVATSKPEVFAIKILKHLKIDQYFEKIYGSDLDGTHSDKTILLKHILEQAPKEASLIVGDRKFDIIAGLQNGIQSLGVTYGYGSKEELEEAGAHNLCNSPNEIYHWINS